MKTRPAIGAASPGRGRGVVRTLTGPLAIDLAVDFLVGVLYGYAGLLLGRRRVSGPASGAATMFSLWWYGLSATGFLAAAITFAASQGAELAVLVSLSQVITFAFCLGLWGLVYYLAYLFSGRRGLLVPLGFVYGLYFALQVYLLHAQVPIGYDAGGWRPMLVYARPIESAWVGALFALPLLPLVAGMLALSLVYPRTQDPTLRYRVVLIVASLTTWIIAVVLISRPELAASAFWQVLARLIVLASGLAILFAYRPPRSVQRRWHIQSSV